MQGLALLCLLAETTIGAVLWNLTVGEGTTGSDGAPIVMLASSSRVVASIFPSSGEEVMTALSAQMGLEEWSFTLEEIYVDASPALDHSGLSWHCVTTESSF